MKNRLIAAAVALGLAISSTSCMTTYDAYGRPVQTVDPGLAVAGIAAAGLIGYAIAEGNDNDCHDNYYRGGYHRPYYDHGCYRPSYSSCDSDYWDW
ncbi:MAG: hypothetical protein ACKO2G_08750 [Verrucomicrobiales bacterium]